ncbi:hypothetical protein LEMLEM_LOCUS24925, partial [Lemmus lemmus]
GRAGGSGSEASQPVNVYRDSPIGRRRRGGRGGRGGRGRRGRRVFLPRSLTDHVTPLNEFYHGRLFYRED